MIFKRHWLFWAFIIFFAGLLAYKLTRYPKPLYDWDESLYVENGLEMLRLKSFLVPLWQEHPWLDKPPLTPLLFGLVASIPGVAIELSTRYYTLFLSVIALILIYRLYLQASRNPFVSTLAAALTCFTAIFVQRAQVVSLDVTLLIGWLGFFLFVDKPIFSTLFLFLGVQSKSLLGFYPLAVYGVYLLYTNKFRRKYKIIVVQTLFLSFWYVAALVVYGQNFWQAHIIESHFRRVAASLESHFGARTFYLDLIREQLGWWFWLSLAGIAISLYRFIKRQINPQTFLLQNAFLPWFVFLNLTRTKIAWYLYPAIPQFAFYAAYALTLVRHHALQAALLLFLTLAVVYRGVVLQNLMGTFYSAEDAHVKIAKYARRNCNNLAVLVPDYTRQTYMTLKKMNLTIQTTNWWGEHPSMVYYFGKPLRFFYHPADFNRQLAQFDCAIVNNNDRSLLSKSQLKLRRAFDKMLLYR